MPEQRVWISPLIAGSGAVGVNLFKHFCLVILVAGSQKQLRILLLPLEEVLRCLVIVDDGTVLDLDGSLIARILEARYGLKELILRDAVVWRERRD